MGGKLPSARLTVERAGQAAAVLGRLCASRAILLRRANDPRLAGLSNIEALDRMVGGVGGCNRNAWPRSHDNLG